MTNKKPIYLDSKRKSDANPQRSLPRMLEQIRDHAINKLEVLFTKMLDDADDALFDLADKALSNRDQTLFFDSMRELRIKRKGMENIFSQQLQSSFHALQDIKSAIVESKLEERPLETLSLVQEDELEENLAIDAMVSKAAAINESALRQIVIRFDTLLANLRMDSDNNPLDPSQICQAFRVACALLDLNIKSKLVVFKLFDRLVVSKFDQVYEEINHFLVNSGVLPDLTLTADAYTNSSESKTGKTTDAEATDTETDSENDFIGTLRELLTEQKSVTSASNVTSGLQSSARLNAPSVNNGQLVQALSKVQAKVQVDVQQQFAANDVHLSLDELRNQIGKVLDVPGPVSSQTIGQASDDVIDIISMLFDFILDDKNLPDEFKALIGRLQIPMLKVAIIDQTFFSKGNHPARKLLNEMAHAGVGWEQGSGIGLKDKVEEIVNLIVNEFQDDPTLFADALADFQQFNEQHNKRALLIERRMKEAEEGKAKTETAKFTSQKVLEEIVADKLLPETVHQLLFDDWFSVLSLVYLREGEQSESWKTSLHTAETIMSSLNPVETVESKQQLTANLPALANNIKAGLDIIGYSEYETTQLLKDLQKLHQQVLAGETVILESAAVTDKVLKSEVSYIHQELPLPTVEELSEELLEIENADEIQTDDENGLPAPGSYFDSSLTDSGSLHQDDEYMTLVEALQAGSWFELSEHEKGTRCKLAAVISSIGKYIFVNNIGKKIAEYVKIDLALAFRRGEIIQIDDGALFDRALKSIVADFRTKQYQDNGL